jgi:hypothetical protein
MPWKGSSRLWRSELVRLPGARVGELLSRSITYAHVLLNGVED